MTWIVELLDERVGEELESLPFDMQARFRRIAELIQGYGLERVRGPHVKHLEGPLWEMRMKGKDGIAASSLCDGECAPGGGGAGVRKEDPENSPARDRYRVATSQGGK